MSNFEEQLNKKIEENPQFEHIDLKDLPDTIEARVSKFEYKKDARERECLFFTFVTKDKRMFTQKYTVSAWTPLNETIAKAGGYEYLTKNFVIWKKRIIGKSQKPRMYPPENEITQKRKK